MSDRMELVMEKAMESVREAMESNHQSIIESALEHMRNAMEPEIESALESVREAHQAELDMVQDENDSMRDQIELLEEQNKKLSKGKD